jgi:hypothetical protein
VSDTDTAVVKSLKVLDPNRPIREADMLRLSAECLLSGAKRTSRFQSVMSGSDRDDVSAAVASTATRRA